MGGSLQQTHSCKLYKLLWVNLTDNSSTKGQKQTEKKKQEDVHTCNQLFNHCDRSPAEKEEEGRGSKQNKNVNKGPNDSAGYQAKSRCRKKCIALNIYIYIYLVTDQEQEKTSN